METKLFVDRRWTDLLFKEFSATQFIVLTNDCWFNNIVFNFFLTNGKVAQRSEFCEDPLTTIPFSPGRFL